MARTVRSRTRASGNFVGHLQDYLSADKSSPAGRNTITVSYGDECADRVGRPVIPSPFTSTQRRGCMFIDGFMSNGVGLALGLESVPYLASSGLGVQSDPLSPPSGWVLTLIARTNPSRPNLNPPEMLQNLVELPRMIRNLWNFLQHPKTVLTPRGAANEYLGLQFGWIPFVKDITDLLDLQGLIDKRLKELDKLHSGEGLRRRIPFGGDTQVAVGSTTFPGLYSVSVTVSVSHKIVRKSWATIRWKPSEPLPFYHPSDARYRNHIRNVVLGLTPEGLAKGLWAVIPWTWLIGWFTNVGSYALAKSNSIPATWTEACFMSQRTWTAEPMGYKTSGLSKGNYALTGGYSSTVKTRIIGSSLVTPGLNMPFLDMFKLSVLGALGTQRFNTLALFRS